MMICAELAKSPNCASHITSELGFSSEYPSSNPSTPNSLSDELETVKKLGCLLSPYTERSGTHLAPVFWSCRSACLWLNVPRSTSCPLRRTWLPSSSNVPNASASAIAQSTPSPVSIIFRRASYTRLTTRCGANPAGMAVMASPTLRSVSILTPVCLILDSWSGPLKPCQWLASQSRGFGT